MSDDAKKLDDSLQRVARAMTALSTQLPARPPPGPPETPLARRRGSGFARFWMVGSIATSLIAGHYGHHSLSHIAFGAAIVGALGFVFSQARRGMRQVIPDRPHIGMGVSVGRGAKVHPGATVEMGAHIGRDAVVEAGAVVKMGASIARDAVIEKGAVVSWGASVRRGARVGAGARIGAGASVGRGAVVPPNAWVMTGSSFQAGNAYEPDDDSDPDDARESAPAIVDPPRPGVSVQETIPAAQPAAPAIDPRQEKLAAVFARIDQELAASPEQIREHLGASVKGISALRETCTSLLARERALRAESTPESLQRLDAERTGLTDRIAKADDEAVKLSLASAVSAIDEQKRQRQLLAKSADRLDAELTRLFWTLDGLAAQLLRMRTAGAEMKAGPDAELTRSVQQLQSEIDAIADALEQVAREDRMPAAAMDAGLASAPNEENAVGGAAKEKERA